MAHGTNNGILKITLNLTFASILSGSVIAAVYFYTAPFSRDQRVQQKNQSMKELIPDAAEFRDIQGKPDWFTALKDGKTVGYIVLAEGNGYGGAIKILTAIDPEMKIIGYKILSHNETPGLGDQAAQPEFMKQFTGKKIENLEVVKVHAEGKIDAITGATITSRAVTNAIKESMKSLEEYISKNK
jgi:Na+-translocating ferredoxin:NAD+ oxidoreductase subunit G